MCTLNGIMRQLVAYQKSYMSSSWCVKMVQSLQWQVTKSLRQVYATAKCLCLHLVAVQRIATVDNSADTET